MQEFLDSHPVFTTEDLERYRTAPGTVGERANESLLAYYAQAGRVRRIRRGLYAVVPRGVPSRAFRPDPYLVASRMAPDAVVAFGAALAMHGFTESPPRQVHFTTAHQVRKTAFMAVDYIPVSAPSGVEGREGVTDVMRSGMAVAVTTPERTAVDVLARPELAGEPEKAWRMLSAIPHLDAVALAAHALRTRNATTAAKAGYFLETYREKFGTSGASLARLRLQKPKQPHYVFGARNAASHIVADWNIIVPDFMENTVAHELEHTAGAFWETARLEELTERQRVGEPVALEALYGLWPGEPDDGFEDEIAALRKQAAA